jgi:hypothetical protein
LIPHPQKLLGRVAVHCHRHRHIRNLREDDQLLATTLTDIRSPDFGDDYSELEPVKSL